jgi:hypothetical protein
MPVPFGFGVGDFIAIASLANGIIKSLSEARGSAVQYASLIELLRGLSDSISTITKFLGSSSTGAPLRIDDAFRNGICFHWSVAVAWCLNFWYEGAFIIPINIY